MNRGEANTFTPKILIIIRIILIYKKFFITIIIV
jgi:hypothetical protein